jgi:hypothetical protein
MGILSWLIGNPLKPDSPSVRTRAGKNSVGAMLIFVLFIVPFAAGVAVLPESYSGWSQARRLSCAGQSDMRWHHQWRPF